MTMVQRYGFCLSFISGAKGVDCGLFALKRWSCDNLHSNEQVLEGQLAWQHRGFLWQLVTGGLVKKWSYGDGI